MIIETALRPGRVGVDTSWVARSEGAAIRWFFISWFCSREAQQEVRGDAAPSPPFQVAPCDLTSTPSHNLTSIICPFPGHKAELRYLSSTV